MQAEEALAIAKSYTKETLQGMGALQGEKGDAGRGISKIEKTATNGLIDTYTITYTDSTTSTFEITNGADGSSSIPDEQIAEVVEKYLAENPVNGLTDDEKEFLNKIVTTGKGTKFLADDGTYKTIEASSGNGEAWDGKTIDVILFQGQSNMAGMAAIPQKPDIICEYGWQFHHKNYKNGETDVLIPIADGFGSGDNFYDSQYCADVNGGTHSAGLQLSFAKRYYELNKVPVVGVSCSFAGNSSDKFIPTNTTVNPNWNVQTNQKMKDCISYLEAEGYVIRHKYAMYLQGESDGDENFTAAKHKTNLRSIFDSFVSNWGCEKIILVRIGNSNDSGAYDKYRNILQAQNELAYEHDDIIMGSMAASTFRDRGLMSDVWHYTLEGYRELGNDIANTMYYFHTYNSQRPLFDKETNVLFPSVRVMNDGVKVKINGVWCTLSVVADVAPTGLTLNPTANISIDGTVQLKPTLTPSDTTAKVGYSSNNEAVAKVSSDGLVTGIAAGAATITAYFVDYPELKATCEVTVSEVKANLASETEFSKAGSTSESHEIIWEIKTNAQINSGEKVKMSFNIAGTAKMINEGATGKIEITSMGHLGYSRWYTSNTITTDEITLTRDTAQTNTLTASNNIAAGVTIAKLTIPANCEYDIAITNLEITK